MQVNGEDLRSVSHDMAAKTLKSSGIVVELLLEYRPKEYEDFQQEVENFKEQLPPATPLSPGIVTTEKKSFYIRYDVLCQIRPLQNWNSSQNGSPSK